MNRFSNGLISSVLASLMITNVAMAETKTSYEYPELLVTPSASERLAMESKIETSIAWSNQSPIMLSAFGTLVTGYMAMNDPGINNDGTETETPEGEKPDLYYIGAASVAAGAGWLAATAFFAITHRPYTAGTKAVSKLPAKTKRQKLIRERIAEEHLVAPAAISKKMKWVSFVTNLALVSFIGSKARNDGTKIMSGVGTMMTFLPFFFNDRWETVAQQHHDYKKRIYGPVSGATILYDQKTARLSPALTLTLAL